MINALRSGAAQGAGVIREAFQPEQMVRNITKIAVPAIVLAATTMITEVKAVTYVECMNNCDQHRDAHPIAKLLCYTVCLIFAKG